MEDVLDLYEQPFDPLRPQALEYLTRLGLSSREAESQVQAVQRELILAQRRRFEIAEKRKRKKPKGYIARR